MFPNLMAAQTLQTSAPSGPSSPLLAPQDSSPRPPSLANYSAAFKHSKSNAVPSAARSRGFHIPPPPIATLMQGHTPRPGITVGICPPTPALLLSLWRMSACRHIQHPADIFAWKLLASDCLVVPRLVFDDAFPGQYLINKQQLSSLLDAGGNTSVGRH